MSILFSNPPWWENKESRGFLRKKGGEEVYDQVLDGHLPILEDVHQIIQELMTTFPTLIS